MATINPGVTAGVHNQPSTTTPPTPSPEFCRRHRLSESFFYKLRAKVSVRVSCGLVVASSSPRRRARVACSARGSHCRRQRTPDSKASAEKSGKLPRERRQTWSHASCRNDQRNNLLP